jgi:hypothetical protein
MKDLSHIGRPGADEERRIVTARRRNTPLQLGASERGERSRKYFSARGSAQLLEKAQFGQGNPRKTKPFSWELFARAWPDLAEFGWIWIGLGSISTCTISKASMPIAATNRTANLTL